MKTEEVAAIFHSLNFNQRYYCCAHLQKWKESGENILNRWAQQISKKKEKKTEKVQSKTARQVCNRENILAMNKHVRIHDKNCKSFEEWVWVQYSRFFHVKLKQQIYSTMLFDENSTNFVDSLWIPLISWTHINYFY